MSEPTASAATCLNNQPIVLFQVAMGTAKLENKRILSDPRKGTLLLCLINSELHLQWKCRETGVVEQDLKLSKDTLFQRVDGVQDGNIYVLKDNTSGKKYFYWLQQQTTKERDGAYYALQMQHWIDSSTKANTNQTISDEYSSAAANSLETVLQNLRQFQTQLTDLNQVLSAERIVPVVSDPNVEQVRNKRYSLKWNSMHFVIVFGKFVSISSKGGPK